jgi:hypothetical protein
VARIIELPPQDVPVDGRKLFDKDDKFMGTVEKQLTMLGICSMHPNCHGPVIRFTWAATGKTRRECLYNLIRVMGYIMR